MSDVPVTDAGQADDAFALSMPARPYPGLRPFDENEWPIFFGRERMVDAVVSRLVVQQLVVVHGDSGSGKSSLIRAGVLPRLRQEQARGGARWRTVKALPRGGPLGNLARALAAMEGRAADTERVLALRRALNQGREAPAALAELLLAGPHDHLCLLIDQFEELFEHALLNGPGEARLLTDALVAQAQTPTPGLHIALTMRSEYLGACARFPGFAEAVNLRQYLLPPMAVTDLLRAIREPARLYGGDVEPALAERLAADAAGIDGLPLVQHALMQMQRAHDATAPWRLTLADYPEGGPAAQLSRHADAVASQAALAVPGRDRLVEDLLRALTTLNAEGHAVRRPQTLQALAGVLQVEWPLLARAVDVFRAEGACLLGPLGEQPLQADDWIDVGHESLIRCWRQLADPADGWLVREFRSGLIWRSLLVQAESFEHNPDSLLDAATTVERAAWLKRRNAAWAERYGGGWNRVGALVDASQARRTTDLRRRRWRLVGGVVGIFAASAVAAAYYYQVAVTDRIKEQRDLARAAESAASAASQRTQSLLLDTQASTRQLETALTELRRQARAPGNRETLASAVLDATQQFADVVDRLDSASQRATVADPASAQRPRPLVYIQFADPAQGDAARRLQRLLARQRLGNEPVEAPGVEPVDKATARAVLRCFHAAECRDEAPRMLDLINALLVSPKLTIEDVSATFEKRGVRARQYEIWFSAGEIVLSTPAADTAASR